MATEPQPASLTRDDLARFRERLATATPAGRKLLTHIAELAYHGRGQQRQPDTAYLPELYECSGVGVEQMYELMKDLQQAKLVEVEEEYPFEDVKIAMDPISGANALGEVARECERRGVSLRDVLVDLDFAPIGGGA
jgi:hypothetical protein